MNSNSSVSTNNRTISAICQLPTANCRLITVFLLFFLGFIVLRPAPTFAQGQSGAFICDSLKPESEGALIVAAYQLGDCLDEVADIDSSRKLVHILELDVIRYFDLGGLYDTDAKQSDFKKTKEYQDKLAELTKFKNEIVKHYFFSVLTTNLGKFSWAFKGYKFDMDKLVTPGGVIGVPPPPGTMFYDIDLSHLPFETTNKTDQDIVLLVDPDNGMSIDKTKEGIVTLVLYKLGDVVTKEYDYYNEQCHCTRKAKEDVIKTKFDRVMIFNSKSNEIYLDRNYN